MNRFRLTNVPGSRNPRAFLSSITNLDKILILVIIVALISIIASLGYVMTHQTEEHYTEFYILGTGGKADDYPKKLNTGEEGRFLLAMTNREDETIEYKIEIYLGELPYQEIRSIILDPDETWGDEFTFVPQEPSALTWLAEDVNSGTYQGTTAVTGNISVLSTEHLKIGDYFILGKEIERVQSIEGNRISVEGEIEGFYPAESRLTEIEKMRLRLYKTRILYEGDNNPTSLSLWLGREDLNSTVMNEGDKKAEYEIEVNIKVKIDDNDTRDYSESTGIFSVEPGAEHQVEMDYRHTPGKWQNAEFTLYRDGQTLYYEQAVGGYPELTLWFHVSEEEIEPEYPVAEN